MDGGSKVNRKHPVYKATTLTEEGISNNKSY